MSEYVDREPIGTIRFEQHPVDEDDGGYSIWVKVGMAVPDESIGMWRIAGCWQCVYSSAVGNPGLTLPSDVVEENGMSEIIGTIPGTPAAQAKRGLS